MVWVCGKDQWREMIEYGKYKQNDLSGLECFKKKANRNSIQIFILQ